MSLMSISHISSHLHSYSNHTVSVWSQCHMRILILSEDQLEVILYLTPSCLFKALTDYLISVELDTPKHQAGLLWCHSWQSDSQIQKQFCNSPICFKQYFEKSHLPWREFYLQRIHCICIWNFFGVLLLLSWSDNLSL